MSYIITDYTKEQAKKLGVEVKPSKKKGKKIDVIKDNKVITSVGAKGYKDFPTYIKEDGIKIANERRRLYKKRHAKNKGVAGFYANSLLW